MDLSDIWQPDRVSLYNSPAVRFVTLPGGGVPGKLCEANNARSLLAIGHNNTGTLTLAPSSQVTASGGWVNSNVTGPLIMTMDEMPMLPTLEWWGFPSVVNMVILVVEVVQERDPSNYGFGHVFGQQIGQFGQQNGGVNLDTDTGTVAPPALPDFLRPYIQSDYYSLWRSRCARPGRPDSVARNPRRNGGY